MDEISQVLGRIGHLLDGPAPARAPPAEPAPERAKRASALADLNAAVDALEKLSEDWVDGPSLIVIEGDIGAGKSTLLKGLAARLRAEGISVVEVAEPVDVWVRLGALQKFYADPSFAYQFQTLVYATRILAFTKAIAAASARGEEPAVVLAERSPATDALFASLAAFTPMEREMYRAWCDAHNEVGELGAMIRRANAIYLRPSVAACEARCEARGRDGEKLDPEYRRRLRAAHDIFLLGEAQVPADAAGLEVPRAPYKSTYVLDCDEPVEALVEQIVEQWEGTAE